MLRNQIQKKLQALADPQVTKTLSSFFKTSKGSYAEDEVFIGIKVPVLRKLAKSTLDELSLEDLNYFFASPIHEWRLFATLALVELYKKSKKSQTSFSSEALFDFYLQNTARINNWDLVDLSCKDIVGDFLLERPRDPLYQFIVSENMWERRIAIVSCFPFIKQGDFREILHFAELTIKDPESLNHKASGWMLRELRKKDPEVLENFLHEHYSYMPRVMLRYAIERMEEEKRKSWLRKK